MVSLFHRATIISVISKLHETRQLDMCDQQRKASQSCTGRRQQPVRYPQFRFTGVLGGA